MPDELNNPFRGGKGLLVICPRSLDAHLENTSKHHNRLETEFANRQLKSPNIHIETQKARSQN
jgi:hypothetical protein